MLDHPDWERGVRLVGADITLDIKIEAADVDLNIIFTDQSVAVWGAAAWFSRQGDQVFILGQKAFAANASGILVNRTVPTGKTFYIAGYSWGTVGFVDVLGSHGLLRIAASTVVHLAGPRGGHVVFDVPLVAEAGELVEFGVSNVASAEAGYQGGFWGWDEDVE